MLNIKISNVFGSKVPDTVLACILSDVEVSPVDSVLWEDIQKKVKTLSSMPVEEISRIKSIAESRKAYKLCGKDPARYRLSAEALLRRVVKRGEIYQINNVVDLLNLVSISSGFSIGGYDMDKIEGSVELGIGEEGEPYEGIGRGLLNIHNMPVFRDSRGAFGTPTSDAVRTSVSLNTKQFLMVIVDYGGSGKLETASNQAISLLEKYAGAKNTILKFVRYNEEIL